ncbi:hypothetical protein SK128_028279, partial [Halocaridina rubra]
KVITAIATAGTAVTTIADAGTAMIKGATTETAVTSIAAAVRTSHPTLAEQEANLDNHFYTIKYHSMKQYNMDLTFQIITLLTQALTLCRDQN